jgi:hypothetical protein
VLWRVSRLVTGGAIAFEREKEPAAKGTGARVRLLRPTKSPVLFILIWQVVTELIVQ